MRRSVFFGLLPLLVLMSCARLKDVGKPPDFTSDRIGDEFNAMTTAPLPVASEPDTPTRQASLWSGNRRSLLGDRRAIQRGDILTVVIEINDKAEISNTSKRNRSGAENLAIPHLFGIPHAVDTLLPAGSGLANAVSTDSSSASTGNGSVRRNEKLTLRVAATITGVLPNGVLQISGRQEVRVNFEMRELLVSGYVRPEDISRQNEITYDKIASARISYGGRGQISDVQQPRYGLQIADIVLPF